MVYIKHMVTNLGLNTWGFVFYNNLLSLMMAPLFLIVTGEYNDVLLAVYGIEMDHWIKPGAIVAVPLSCAFGLAISFFGFAARKAISATAFTVTGVINKFLTVAINVMIWDKHASPLGLVCLLFTLVGGVLYQQSVTAPSQPQNVYGAAEKQPEEAAEKDGEGETDDEEKKLLNEHSKV